MSMKALQSLNSYELNFKYKGIYRIKRY